MSSVIGTINLINASRHYLHIYTQEYVMCPAHVECQKFQIPSPNYINVYPAYIIKGKLKFPSGLELLWEIQIIRHICDPRKKTKVMCPTDKVNSIGTKFEGNSQLAIS